MVDLYQGWVLLFDVHVAGLYTCRSLCMYEFHFFRVRNQKARKSINMRDSEIGERVAFHTSPIVKTKKGSKMAHKEESERVQLAAEET